MFFTTPTEQMSDFFGSPCPNCSGLVSLFFKAFVMAYFCYMMSFVFGPPMVGFNYWVSESSHNLEAQETYDAVDFFNIKPQDIRLKIGDKSRE